MGLTKDLDGSTEKLTIELLKSDYSNITEELIRLCEEGEEKVASEAAHALMRILPNNCSDKNINRIINIMKEIDCQVKISLSYLLVVISIENKKNLESYRSDIKELIENNPIVNKNLLFILCQVYGLKQ